jgi:hypothetical protein
MYAVLCFVVVMAVQLISLFIAANARVTEVNHRGRNPKIEG